MKTASRGRKILSVSVVTVDILLILVAVAEFIFLDIDTLEPVYLVNASVNFTGMIIGVVLMICCYVDYQQLGINQRYYRYLLEGTFICLFADLTSWMVNERASLWMVNLLINTLFYVATPITAFFFWRYVTTQLMGGSDSRIEKADRLIEIMVILNIFVCVLNIYGGFFFSVDRDGVYVRGPLFPVFMLMTFVIITLIAIFIILKRKTMQRRQIVALFVYILTPLPVLLGTIFIYGLSLNHVMLMIDTLMMYCVLYVDQGREKLVVKNELSLATRIQQSMLPTIFPPYPGRKEFDIYASMTPTKEVGGDFYDFFLIDDDHLGLVMADVSDKGVPAAMCMMATKILIANNLKRGKDPGQALYDANNSFCAHNEEDMFITAWVATLEISTGKLTCVNAGHEYPLIKHGGEDFVIFEDKHGKPIGWMEDSVYEEYEIMLSPGDMVFVYTDGVLEAANKTGEMYGMDRTLAVLNRLAEEGCEKTIHGVWEDVNTFANGAEQFDDLTMLAMKYIGKPAMQELCVEAVEESLPEVTDFISETLGAEEFSSELQMQIRLVSEEIFVNIASYAYANMEPKDTPLFGKALIGCEKTYAPPGFIIRFTDEGVPFDPLAKEDADTSGKMFREQEGGFGIYLAKQNMDTVEYEYRDGKNILTLQKSL